MKGEPGVETIFTGWFYVSELFVFVFFYFCPETKPGPCSQTLTSSNQQVIRHTTVHHFVLGTSCLNGNSHLLETGDKCLKPSYLFQVLSPILSAAFALVRSGTRPVCVRAWAGSWPRASGMYDAVKLNHAELDLRFIHHLRGFFSNYTLTGVATPADPAPPGATCGLLPPRHHSRTKESLLLSSSVPATWTNN